MGRDAAGTSILTLCAVALGLLMTVGADAQTTGQAGNPTTNPPITAPIVITAPPASPPAARDVLGAPTVAQPGAAAPYVAPQYPAAPAYGAAANPAVGQACRRYAPAYDESGRFLATVCVR
jgi:hypothetical protein